MNTNEKNVQQVPAEKLAELCVRIAEDKLAENIVAIDMKGKSSVTDYLVIATANSLPHLTALANFMERQVLEECGRKVYSGGGDSQSGWVVLDFITVVVHLMLPDMRSRYGLESLWNGAPAPEALNELEAHLRRRKG